MNLTSGKQIRRRHRMGCDVVIVGSGPAGASVAASLANRGLDVVVVEAGSLFEPSDFAADSFTAMTTMYRDAGAQVTRTLPSMPLVQGVAVGGTSVINGAISWRLPRDVWDEWIEADPALQETLQWERLERAHDEVERDLRIAPTDPDIAGPNNDLLSRGAEALGLEHRPIRRNVTGCEGLGRCLQGCPKAHKASMDRTYLPMACKDGAKILSDVEVRRVVVRDERATGVIGRSTAGARVEIAARVGVVLAASALQTPALLWKSGLRRGPVGEHFQAHPGVAVSGRHDEPVRVWEGATQGREVTGLRREGIKFEALGFGYAMAASRLTGVGRELQPGLDEIEHHAHWGAAVRATAEGRVRPGRFGVRVDYRLTADDLRKIRRGVAVLGELQFAAGARQIYPSAHGWATRVADRADWGAFQSEGPLTPTAYTPAITHMFGTCRMGSDPADAVVRPDFRHHHTERLWVADSSVFPSNTGVNPQTSICALAMLCAHEISKRC